MARKPVKQNQPEQEVIDSTKNEAKPAQGEVTTPSGTQRLGKGLWGIVGNKTRYGTVTQFSGLEYVRYEYRRIPEEYRDVAFKNDFLDVIDITEDLPPVDEETEVSFTLTNELVEGKEQANAGEEAKENLQDDDSSKG